MTLAFRGPWRLVSRVHDAHFPGSMTLAFWGPRRLLCRVHDAYVPWSNLLTFEGPGRSLSRVQNAGFPGSTPFTPQGVCYACTGGWGRGFLGKSRPSTPPFATGGGQGRGKGWGSAQGRHGLGVLHRVLGVLHRVLRVHRVHRVLGVVLPSSCHKQRRSAFLPETISGPSLINRFFYSRFSSSLGFSPPPRKQLLPINLLFRHRL